MAWDSKSKHNKNTLRLLKQVEEAKEIEKEYGIKPLRLRSYFKQTEHIQYYDLPRKSEPYILKSWKHYRKQQWK